ncbi:hypothetical protein BJV77DRAFT_1024977 [Russula vinacea]|nr:hypothetical protein BJV77DRAFT_1024977 [Russula vinacea]
MRKCGSRIHPILVETSPELNKRGEKSIISSYSSRGWHQRRFLMRGLHPAQARVASISGYLFPMMVSKQFPQSASVYPSRSHRHNARSDCDSDSLYYRGGHEGVVCRSKLGTPHSKRRDKCSKPPQKAECETEYEAHQIRPLFDLYNILSSSRPTKPLHRRQYD